MLKIKDSVDLKELEKFGFSEDIDDWMVCNDVGDDYYGNPQFELLVCVRNHKEYDLEEVDKRLIHIGVSYLPSVVLDLIQAGLVEKV